MIKGGFTDLVAKQPSFVQSYIWMPFLCQMDLGMHFDSSYTSLVHLQISANDISDYYLACSMENATLCRIKMQRQISLLKIKRKDKEKQGSNIWKKSLLFPMRIRPFPQDNLF